MSSIPAQLLKTKRIILTGGVAAITATGVWYGAGLKIQSEEKKVRCPTPVFVLNHQAANNAVNRRSKPSNR
jgi:hypothetical protein